MRDPSVSSPILSRQSGRTLAVFAVAAVVLLGSLGGYGLWDPDEGRHAAIARELFAATTWRGWLLPSHNFEPQRIIVPR